MLSIPISMVIHAFGGKGRYKCDGQGEGAMVAPTYPHPFTEELDGHAGAEWMLTAGRRRKRRRPDSGRKMSAHAQSAPADEPAGDTRQPSPRRAPALRESAWCARGR